jgi:hypothetical protein
MNVRKVRGEQVMDNKSKAIKKSEKSGKSSGKKLGESLGFGKRNYILMAVGVGFIALGYIFLSIGDTSAATLLLVLGYCAILPAALLISDRKSKDTASETPVDKI